MEQSTPQPGCMDITQPWSLSGGFSPASSPGSAGLSPAARKRLLWLGLTLLCLLLCVGCAGAPPAAPTIFPCRVPPFLLQPIVEPPMQDATNEDLVLEADALRSALRMANTQLALTRQYIERNCK